LVCTNPLLDEFIMIGTFGKSKKLGADFPGGTATIGTERNIFAFAGIYPATRHLVISFRGTQGPDLDNWFK